MADEWITKSLAEAFKAHPDMYPEICTLLEGILEDSFSEQPLTQAQLDKLASSLLDQMKDFQIEKDTNSNED